VDAVAGPNPTIARRHLAVLLRAAREASLRSPEELGRFLGVTAAQVSRLESGVRGYRPDDVTRLAEWYGIRGQARGQLVELASEARRRAWWQQLDLPDAYRTLIGFEQQARSISEYGGSIIPGLLQVPAYAAAVVRSAHPPLSPELVDGVVDVRMRRQSVLDGDHAARLRVVVDEIALARGPRDPAAKREQLKYLLAASDRPHVTIQVIGFELGLHPGDRGQFIIVTPRAPIPDLIYSEGLIGPVELSSLDDIAQYRELWGELRAIALDPEASRERIDRYIR
jgi:transcriptional regulator with XRE-family HTH domain